MFLQVYKYFFCNKANMPEGVCFELNLTFAMERSLRMDYIKSACLKVVHSLYDIH